jgi:hypothetical protein
MSDAIEALSEYKYLLESMGHDAQSTGPYMRCLDAIASLQAMQGEAAPTKTKISEAIFGWGLRNDDGNHLSMDDTDEIAEYIMACAMQGEAASHE